MGQGVCGACRVLERHGGERDVKTALGFEDAGRVSFARYGKYVNVYGQGSCGQCPLQVQNLPTDAIARPARHWSRPCSPT